MTKPTVTLELSETFLRSYADNKARQDMMLAQVAAEGGETRTPMELSMMRTLPILYAAMEDEFQKILDAGTDLQAARAAAIHAMPLFITNLIGTVLTSHVIPSEVESMGCKMIGEVHRLWHTGKKVELVAEGERSN